MSMHTGAPVTTLAPQTEEEIKTDDKPTNLLDK